MNVKELSRMCSKKIENSDMEAIQAFWSEQRKKTKKTNLTRLVILNITLIGITIVFELFTRNNNVELIKNLVPFYAVITIPYIIMIAVHVITDNIITARLVNALRSDSIKVSECRYNLFSTVTATSTEENKSSSTYYYFISENDKSDRFSVGSGQHKCFFDEAEQGYMYKIYSIENKYIFFIRADKK